jgi:formylmethanofuran--tetrahydromethanopterin N-formyltransferase
MKLNDVEIEDTYAEAFPIKIGRVLITAVNRKWAEIAAKEITGFGTSVIGCPAEAGIDVDVPPEETPDGRYGIAILICHPSRKSLRGQLIDRLANCAITSPTVSVFNGLEGAEEFEEIKLRFFGDGFEYKDEVGGREVWKIPVMEGEFVYEEKIGVKEGVAGGNFFILSENQMSALIAAENAVDAILEVEGTITPFPGGVVASGSKVGSDKYKFMHATTNEKLCPTIKEKIEGTQVPKNVEAVYEVVINGLGVDPVERSMKVGIEAAVKVPGVVKISAGNYGGKLGKCDLKLHEIMGA